MNKVDKQFSKLDKKASKFVRKCERAKNQKNKAITPIFVVMFLLSLCLLFATGYIYATSLVEGENAIFSINFITLIPFALLIIAYIISLFLKSQIATNIIILLGYIDILVFVLATHNDSCLKEKLLLASVCGGIFFIANILILIFLKAYRKRFSR